MKLSRRLLIPIMLASFLAVSISSLVYYRIMEREVDSIYRGEILTTMAGLKTEMELTGTLNDAIMERVDGKNVVLARTFAQWLANDPEAYLTGEGLAGLAEFMGMDEIHITDSTAKIVLTTDERYLGRDAMEQSPTDLLPLMQDPEFAGVQQPRVNSSGHWVQYYIISRVDEPGFIIVGIQYSVSTMLQNAFTDGINTDLTKVGETGFVMILHDGLYAAHPDEATVGADASGEGWYAEVFGKETDIDWLTIDGQSYLTGYSTVNDSTLLLALLPHSEYYASLNVMQGFSFVLVFVFSALLIAVLYFSLRRNVIRPLGIITSAVNRVAKGNFSVVINDRFSGEMEQLRRDINKTTTQLKNRQENVLRSYPGIIFSCDNSYTCTLADGQSMEVLGFDPQKYIGNNMVEVLRRLNDNDVADMIESTFSEGTAQRLNQERNGRYLSITTALMYDNDGGVMGLVGVCNDVTDLRELQKQLMAATEEAERASRAKSEFLSRMSHEIRTPMNAIIGMTTIAQKSGEDGAKIQYCLDKIQMASDQLLRLINDILDMSKIEANKFELSEGEFDFEKMLQNVCNVVEVNAAEKKQNFIVDFAEVYTRNIVGDELRLSQILINLLNNAVKFTPEGGQVTLRIRNEEVDTSFVRFHIDVIDNGIGISAEQVQRLFASFEQADGSITRRYGGTGLGLAIVKNIIHMMGGDIEVDSDPGRGSRFSFTVNMAWGNEKGSRDWIQRLPLGNLRTLVIDDNEDVCLYFENIMQNYQIACDSANSGPAGIKRVSDAMEANTPYNLIFVDWMMPGMDGIETARHIKRMAPPNTIVIMISVADWSDIERDAKEIGIDKFLSKPVLPTVLFRSIVEWLNSDEARQAAQDEAVPEFNNKTMLLAEDIDINREIIIGMLDGTGMHIDCAGDGRAAFDMYTKAPNQYDIVLMDIQMPGVDGYEATRLIRQSGLPGAKELPIIAMTANAFSSDVEKCLAAGMDGHIAKPVDIADLYQKLHKALGV